MTDSATVDSAVPGKHEMPAKQPVMMHPIKNRGRRDAVIDAISSLEITKTSAWDDLSALSGGYFRTGVWRLRRHGDGVRRSAL